MGQKKVNQQGTVYWRLLQDPEFCENLLVEMAGDMEDWGKDWDKQFRQVFRDIIEVQTHKAKGEK